MGRFLASVVAVGAVMLVGRDARAQSPGDRAARVTLQIPVGKPRVELRLPAMPPSRTWCRIESESGADGATVVWDPVEPGSLVRTFTAAAGGVGYTLGCWSEAIRPTVKPELNFGYTWMEEAGSPPCSSQYDTFMIGRADGQKMTEAPSAKPPTLEVRCVDKPSLDPAPVTLAARGHADGPSLRSFGALNEAMVQEVFAVLAETIVEQAESRGTKVLEERLRELVCDENLRLPVTCDAVTKVRLADLAASGRQLQEALATDLVARAMDPLKKLGKVGGGTDEVSLVLEGAITAALDLTRGRPERARDAARALLLQLLAAPQGPEEKIVFAIVRDCLTSKSCDPVAIRQRLQEPARYFDVAKAGVKAVPVSWANAATFVNAALRVLEPPATATEAEQLRGVIHLALDLVERRTDPSLKATLQHVAAARRLTDGLLERDAGAIATASIHLFSTTTDDPKLRRLARLATALTSFTTTSTSGREPSEDERAARREARKEALTSLIEEYGSRKHRLGHTVVSVGGGVFVSGGAAFGIEGDRRVAAQVVPLSVPLGLGVDHHGDDGWGFHALVAPVDLGAYVTVRSRDVGDVGSEVDAVKPAVGDALRPALFIGGSKLVTEADLVLVGAATVGVAPKIGLDEGDDAANESAVYVGAVVGAYIPLFDLN